MKNFDENIINVYELRCNKCNEIPYLFFDKIFDQLYIYFYCKNGHKLYDDYKEIISSSTKQNFDNIKCFMCKNKSKYYIIKNQSFYCEDCTKKKNNYIKIERFDIYCKKHINNDLIGYSYDNKNDFCKDCIKSEKNLFFYEQYKNEKNELIININKYKNKIDEFNKTIEKLKKDFLRIIENINKTFNNYINLIEKEKKIYNYLINYFEYKKNCINYTIISNIISNLNTNFSEKDIYKKDIYIENEPIESLKNLYNFFDNNHLLKFQHFCNFENNVFQNHDYNIIENKEENKIIKIIYGNEKNNESIIFEKNELKLKIKGKIFDLNKNI